MAIKKIGSSLEVITLDEARRHLRIEPFGSPLEHPDDNYISSLIAVSREWCEEYLERSIGTATYELVLDKFPDAIQIKPYCQSIESIKYLDIDNALQTISPLDYTLDNYSEPAWVVPIYGKRWPETYPTINAVKVKFVSGYTDGLSPNTNPTPAAIKAAMLLLIGNFYENRQQDVLGNTRISFNSLPLGVYSLLQPYRLGIGL